METLSVSGRGTKQHHVRRHIARDGVEWEPGEDRPDGSDAENVG